jgi:Spy/CpxP family protein refolding chaperone
VSARRRAIMLARTLVVTGVLVLSGADAMLAQRGSVSLPRLDLLIDTFKLTKDQEKSVKMLIDEAGKTATPIREALTKARPAIVAAIQSGRGPAGIDAAVKAYAVQATAMTALEMRTLARLTQVLSPEQRADQAALRSAFFLVRGAFINRNWNEAPNPDKGY